MEVREQTNRLGVGVEGARDGRWEEMWAINGKIEQTPALHPPPAG